MKKELKKVLSIFLAATTLLMTSVSFNVSADSQQIGVTYSAHVQNIGWQHAVQDGTTAGTVGQSLRMEALKINLTNAPQNAHITYSAHVQNIGWKNPVQDGQQAGTTGQALRIEALRINLANLPGYSVIYRVQVQNIGWQPWVCNGDLAGTVGQGLRMESLEVKIVKNPTDISLNKLSDTLQVGNSDILTIQNQDLPNPNEFATWSSSDSSIVSVDNTGKITALKAGNATVTAVTKDENKLTKSCNVVVSPASVTGISLNKTNDTLSPGMTDTLSASVIPENATNKNVTWSSSDSSIVSVDNTGKITALKAGNVTITAATQDGNKTASCTVTVNSEIGISYSAHVQNIGWQDPVQNGTTAGTVGQGLRMEALKVNLIGAPEGAHVKYQAYVENIGWQDASQDNEKCGTTGQNLRVEALKINLVNLPGYSIEYRVQIQNIGWQSWVYDGNLSGTEGRSLRIEAIQIKIVKAISVQYQVHVQNIGWKNSVSDNTITGTNGQPLRIEALKINLNNAPQGMSIQYRAQVQNIGWQPWVTDGNIAGTVGQDLRLEALQIRLVNAPSDFHVQYQTDVQNIGWQPWVTDGNTAGTIGNSLCIRAIRIRVVSNPDITQTSLPAQPDTNYRLADYLDSNSNIESVREAAVQLHDGDPGNTCVYFSSEALRRIGYAVPKWMANTAHYVPYLLSKGWTTHYDIDALSPGCVCFTVNDEGGHPTHTFAFLDWVNPDDHTIAYVADNQAGGIHIRSLIDAVGIDALHFFLESL